MPDWPIYRTSKVVRAAKIVGVQITEGVKHLIVDPGTGDPTEYFDPTEEGMKSRVGVGDYALQYPDGFRSVIPKAQFEESIAQPGTVVVLQRTIDHTVDPDTGHWTMNQVLMAFSDEQKAREFMAASPHEWGALGLVMDPEPPPCVVLDGLNVGQVG